MVCIPIFPPQDDKPLIRGTQKGEEHIWDFFPQKIKSRVACLDVGPILPTPQSLKVDCWINYTDICPSWVQLEFLTWFLAPDSCIKSSFHNPSHCAFTPSSTLLTHMVEQSSQTTCATSHFKESNVISLYLWKENSTTFLIPQRLRDEFREKVTSLLQNGISKNWHPGTDSTSQPSGAGLLCL